MRTGARRCLREPGKFYAARFTGEGWQALLDIANAIDLALENNLDLVIARYNLPIAQMDVLRTEAGGTVRGVNTGVVSGTPGGAGGLFGASSGAGAAARVAARVAREPERRDWCSRRWARARR